MNTDLRKPVEHKQSGLKGVLTSISKVNGRAVGWGVKLDDTDVAVFLDPTDFELVKDSGEKK